MFEQASPGSSARQRRTILILEDDEDRLQDFRNAVLDLGPKMLFRHWREAPAMITDCPAYFASACLISLDHDLQALPGETADPGTGLDVAQFLAGHKPVCPVILHSSNFDGRLVMQNTLRAGGWTVATLAPRGDDWVQTLWLPIVGKLLRKAQP